MMIQIEGRTEHPYYDPDFFYVESTSGAVYVQDRGSLRRLWATGFGNEHDRWARGALAYARERVGLAA